MSYSAQELNTKVTLARYESYRDDVGILHEGLGRLEGALVVGIVANYEFVEQRGARSPQRQQHGQQHEHNHHKERNTALACSVGASQAMGVAPRATGR